MKVHLYHETVYRLKKVDWEKYKTELEEVIGSYTPVSGYSTLRPRDDEICIYFYQTFGGGFLLKLEELEIQYDTEQWLTMFDWNNFQKRYDKIEGGEDEGIFKRKPHRISTDEST